MHYYALEQRVIVNPKIENSIRGSGEKTSFLHRLSDLAEYAVLQRVVCISNRWSPTSDFKNCKVV